jgi:hypothetical protein
MRKSFAVTALAVLLRLGVASPSFAATRDGGGEPGITRRIVRVIKQIQKFFVPGSTDDTWGVPKP